MTASNEISKKHILILSWADMLLFLLFTDSSAVTETGVIIAHGIFIISMDECEISQI